MVKATAETAKGLQTRPVKRKSVKRTMRETRSDRILLGVVYAFLALVIVVILYPIIFIFSSSVSSYSAVLTGKVIFWPVGFTLLGYLAVFRDPAIITGFINSVIYTVAGTAVSVALTILMAYTLAQRQFPGKRLIIMLLVFAMIFNGGLIPFYIVVERLGMINTRWSMILPSALGIWQVILAKTFFQSTISPELQEAAEMDGCGHFRFLWSIVIPISKPIIAVLALLYAVGQWNAYFNPLLFLNSSSLYPLQLVLQSILISPNASNFVNAQQYQLMMAMETLLKYAVIVITTVPIVLVYPLVQKYFVKGVMVGSLKG